MSKIDNLLTWEGKSGTFVKDRDRSAEVGMMIDHETTTITIIRGASTTLAAQTVRVAPVGSSGQRGQMRGEAGQPGENRLVLVGKPTLDIQIGDRFSLQGARYIVRFVDKTMTGRTEAHAEAQQ